MSYADHIRVKRTSYYHHGIDIGKGKVIHFTGEPGRKENASVQETTMDKFLNGGELEIVKYAKCISESETNELARQHLGQTKYNLVFNNCEHFARYCKTKEKKSEQVERAITNTSASVVIGAAVSGSLTVISSAGASAGLSAAGIMSGLAVTGPGGVIGGIGTLAALPTVISNVAVSKTLKDDKHLPDDERSDRKTGRISAKIGSAAGAIGTVGIISTVGSVTGLSGAGITSGLAAIGGTVGGGMAVGVTIAIAAPAVAAAVAGFSVYKLVGWIKKR